MGEKFKKFVVELRDGMSQAMTISTDRAYIRPENKSFKIDNYNLNNDARKIGRDLKNNIKQR